MSDVVIAGVGMTPVGEHWEISLRSLAARAMLAAIKDAGGIQPQALYIGNLLASVISHQSNLGALLTDNAGLHHIESYTVEAADASGAGAFRLAYLAVRSGFVDAALVVGVDKLTDWIDGQEMALAQATDYDYEAMQGVTFTSQAGLLAQRYQHQYDPPQGFLSGFPLLGHANAVSNPNAMFRRAVDLETYARAGMKCDPLNLYDIAPLADGAAAALITRASLLPADFPHPRVRVSGSAVVTDRLALHDRPDPLAFDASRISVDQACRQAGILPGDVDLLELHDSFSIHAVLALEAAGYAERGKGWQMAQSGDLSLTGSLPAQTFGGLKARGFPIGASGVYQVAEATLQLRGTAGANQVPGARRALVQSLGGPASTAITHVLERL